MATKFASRNDAVAIKEETTEGTPVVVAAGTDFVAVQDDFSMVPEFEVLENAEKTGSIGRAKGILGDENPTASFSHYLRHSGVEGTAPNYKLLLESLFGAEDDAGVEHNTVASSTTSLVKVDSGEGATYIRGQGLLVKHAANPWEIAMVESISGDDLTPMFNLQNAPGTGVDLGEAVTYYPANSGHPTLSLWHYVANEAAVQLMAGARTASGSFTFTAGELINASYSLEGTSFYYNPFNVAATDIYLDFTDDQGTAAAVITAKVYKDPVELADALTAAMNAVTTETHSVVWNSTGANAGKFTISTSTSAVLSLLWNTGTNAANTVGDLLGFSTAADDTGATTYTSDNEKSWAASVTPTFDSSDPLVAKDNRLMVGDADDNACLEADEVTVEVTNTLVDVDSICAVSGKSGKVISVREATITVSAYVQKHEVDKWYKFRSNSNVKFQYNFGVKEGGNWVAGKCGALGSPTATITSFEVVDNDTISGLNFTLQPYVNASGQGEIFLTFV